MMKFACQLSAVAMLLFASLLAAQTNGAQNSGWNDDAQKCLDLSGDDAIAACTRAINSGQLTANNLATTYYNRGYEYRDKRQFDTAIADLNEAIRLDPTMTNAFNNRGLSFYDEGAYDRAITDYDKALQLDPKHINAFYGLGNVYQAEGEYAKAIDNYNQALAINASFSNAFLGRGNVFLAEQKIDQAIADYKDALRTKPAYMYTALLIAVARMHKGDNAVADELTEESKAFANSWPIQIVQFYQGAASVDVLAAAATDPDPQQQQGRLCEMYFYLGEWQVYHGQQSMGIESLKKSKDQCQPDYLEHDLVSSELKRLGQ